MSMFNTRCHFPWSCFCVLWDIVSGNMCFGNLTHVISWVFVVASLKRSGSVRISVIHSNLSWCTKSSSTQASNRIYDSRSLLLWNMLLLQILLTSGTFSERPWLECNNCAIAFIIYRIHKSWPINYTLSLMLVFATSLDSMNKIQKNLCLKSRLVGIIYTKRT